MGKREVDYLERTFRVNRYGDVWFLNKYGKVVHVVAGSQHLPLKLRNLFYDILISEE